ncbi:MAG: helix-turn-helix domain-containing protein [Kiloniellales bacterium]|nr:helix-turn-helix domain-containing protein [Kiloniellales bacterium]
MTPQDAFGSVLRSLRLARKLSQERLALEANLDRTFVSLLERGKRQPSLETLLRVAKVLGLTPAELVTRTVELVDGEDLRPNNPD